MNNIINQIKSLLVEYNDQTWQYAEGNAYYKERDANNARQISIYNQIKQITNDLQLNQKLEIYKLLDSPKYIINAFNINENDLLSNNDIRIKELLSQLLTTSIAMKKDDQWYNTPAYLSKQILKLNNIDNINKRGMTAKFSSFFNVWTQKAGEELNRNPTIIEIMEYGMKNLNGITLWNHRENCEFKYMDIAQEITNRKQQ